MDLLEKLIAFFAENGYVAVFMALLLCGAGLPLPEDITLIAGGVIAGLGYVNVHVMFGVSMLGVLFGDAVMFLLGHHYGVHLLKWRLVARLLTAERYAMVQRKFERYGNRMLFFARFLPGMRTAMFISAGVSHRVSFVRFLLLDGAAALISVPIWVYLGYFGADNRAWLSMWIKRGQAGLWGIGGLVLLAVLLWWWRRKRAAAYRAAGGDKP